MNFTNERNKNFEEILQLQNSFNVENEEFTNTISNTISNTNINSLSSLKFSPPENFFDISNSQDKEIIYIMKIMKSLLNKCTKTQ